MNNKQIITFVNTAYGVRLGLAPAEQSCIQQQNIKPAEENATIQEVKAPHSKGEFSKYGGQLWSISTISTFVYTFLWII